ncbi:MAG: hypothetical protein SynsKO_40900 [Synoicihabitans sp.]
MIAVSVTKPKVSRRAFLGNTLTAAAVTGLVPSVALAGNRMNGQRKLAVASICFDGFGNEKHEPTFRFAPQVGIKNIEFNLWYPEMLTPAYLERLMERCHEAELTPVSLQGTSFGGEGRTGVIKDLTHKLWLLEKAKAMGCDTVKFTGSRRDTNGGLDHVIAVCRELAPAAESLGINVVLENHDRNVLERPEDYTEIFAAIDSPRLGMCLDTGHFEGSGIPLAAVVDQFRSKILHIDLKDCVEFGAGHNTAVFGEGVTDFDGFLSDVIEGGYQGHLVIEMAWREPREPLVRNLINARKKFARYES